jgi:hypothetical protein
MGKELRLELCAAIHGLHGQVLLAAVREHGASKTQEIRRRRPILAAY